MSPRCHEIDYTLSGSEMQLVEIELDPNETVIAEAGSMVYMTQDIQFETRLGDGSPASEGLINKLFSVGKRLFTGESAFTTHFTHGGASGKQHVGFAAPYPGTIIPLDLANYGECVTVQKDSFLAAAKGISIDVTLNRRLGAGFFGGEGFILQQLKGNGQVFIHAGGTVVEKKLNNETLRVDTGCLVGYTQGIDFDIQFSGGLKSMIFGGEGAFLAKLSGTGTVWLQSLPFSRLADRVIQHAPVAKGREQGEN